MSVVASNSILSKYVDVVIARWQELSGRKATLEGNGCTFAAVQRERAKVAA